MAELTRHASNLSAERNSYATDRQALEERLQEEQTAEAEQSETDEIANADRLHEDGELMAEGSDADEVIEEEEPLEFETPSEAAPVSTAELLKRFGGAALFEEDDEPQEEKAVVRNPEAVSHALAAALAWNGPG